MVCYVLVVCRWMVLRWKRKQSSVNNGGREGDLWDFVVVTNKNKLQAFIHSGQGEALVFLSSGLVFFYPGRRAVSQVSWTLFYALTFVFTPLAPVLLRPFHHQPHLPAFSSSLAFLHSIHSHQAVSSLDQDRSSLSSTASPFLPSFHHLVTHLIKLSP